MATILERESLRIDGIRYMIVSWQPTDQFGPNTQRECEANGAIGCVGLMRPQGRILHQAWLFTGGRIGPLVRIGRC